MSLGRLCLILHGHLPYVLCHGIWPHGESWLYEGAAETYLPLLELLDELTEKKVPARITLGLTPVLLEQLAHERFKTGFVAYLHERMTLARHDAAEFDSAGTSDLSALARRWEKWYADRLAFFEKINRDIPTAFAAHFRDGLIEILTSAATHAYLPLLSEDASVARQLAIGIQTSERYLGKKPTGIWLPECAYRPAVTNWQPPVLYDQPRDRVGIESFLAQQNLSHFFVDTHLVLHAKPMAIIDPTGVHPTNDALLFWDQRRGWGSPLDPVRVSIDRDVSAFARHPRVSEQVWSAVTGYPGADAYLEFHRKHGDHGLRYHRVTSHHTPLMEKEPYDPKAVAGKSYEQAQHFCTVIREVLTDFTKQTGRVGTVVASFDAELFGHWWFEGLTFLRDVLLTLSFDGTVDVVTSAQALNQSNIDKVVQLPEGSWGEGGHHDVWLNDRTQWMWEAEYRAEGRFQQLLEDLPWRTNAKVRAMLTKAARELLLLQSSDWPFAIYSAAAADYGINRFSLHSSRFDRLATLAQDVAGKKVPDPVQKTELAEADAHDVIFDWIKLGDPFMQDNQ